MSVMVELRLEDQDGYVVPGTVHHATTPAEADAYAALLAEQAPWTHTVRRIPLDDPVPGGTFADWLAATTVRTADAA